MLIRKPAKHPCCFSRSPKTDMMIVYTSIENKMYMNSFRPYIFKSKELLFYLTLWIWSFTKKNLWLVCLFVYGTACAQLKVAWKTGEYLITVYRVILLQAQRSLSEVKANILFMKLWIRATAFDRKAELAAIISFHSQCFPFTDRMEWLNHNMATAHKSLYTMCSKVYDTERNTPADVWPLLN